MMSCFSGNSVFRQVNSMCLMPRWRCWRSRCARFPRCESAQIRFYFHSNQNLFPLEPESVSTRIRICFHSNQNLYRLDAWEHDGSRYVASLRFGGRKNMAWLRESWHIMRQGCLSSETIPSGRLTDTQIRVKPPDCYLSLFKPPLPYRFFPIKIAVIRFWGANSISWKRRHVN